MHTKLFVKVEYCLLFLFCCSGKNVLFERCACLFDNSDYNEICYYSILNYVNLFVSEYLLLSIVI